MRKPSPVRKKVRPSQSKPTSSEDRVSAIIGPLMRKAAKLTGPEKGLLARAILGVYTHMAEESRKELQAIIRAERFETSQNKSRRGGRRK